MDLFSLVAKLTLDDKAYEKAIKDAEKQAKGAKLDAKGSATIDDKFSSTIKQASDAAKDFKGEIHADITATDHYSEAIASATKAGEEFDPNASDEIDGTDNYSGKIDEATEKGEGFAPDASDEIEGVDQYSDAIEDAKLSAQGFDPDASDVIEGTDEYSEKIAEAENAAAEFSPDASGIIGAEDEYTPALDNAETAARDFSATAEGTVDADDTPFETTLSEAEASAEGFDPEASGTIEGENLYTDELIAAEDEADTADLDVEGEATLDTEEFNSAIDTAEENATGFETTFEDMLEGMKSALVTAGIVGGIIRIGQSFKEAINSSGQLMDTIDKGSQRLSISRKEYQLWDYVLGQNGATISSVQKGFLNLTKFLNGEGTDDINAAMDALGIDPAQYSTTEELFNAVITGLAQMEEGAERDNLVTAIFGRNGMELNAMLNSGVEGIAGLRKEYEELGLVISDEDIAKGVAYQDALDTMNRAVDTLKTRISADVMPMLTEAIQFITQIVGWLAGGEGAPQWLQDIMAALTAVGEALGFLNEDGELQFPDWLKSAMTIIGTAVEAITPLITGIFQVVADIFDFLNPKAGPSRWIEEFGTQRGWELYKQYGRVSDSEFERIVKAIRAGDSETYYQDWLDSGGAEGLHGENVERGAERYGITSGATMAEAIQAIESHGGTVTIVSESEYPATVGGRSRDSEGNPYMSKAGMYNVTIDGVSYSFFVGYAPGIDTETFDQKWVDALLSRLGGRDGVIESLGGRPVGDIIQQNAKGLWSVPYDDYLTNLHRDEMVLTASQAREYRDGLSDNSAIVEAIRGLRTDLTNLQLVVGQKTFGRTVVQYGGRRMGGYIGRSEDKVAAGYGWG